MLPPGWKLTCAPGDQTHSSLTRNTHLRPTGGSVWPACCELHSVNAHCACPPQLAAETRKAAAWEAALRHIVEELDPDSSTRRGGPREVLPAPIFGDLGASEAAGKSIESIAAWYVSTSRLPVHIAPCANCPTDLSCAVGRSSEMRSLSAASVKDRAEAARVAEASAASDARGARIGTRLSQVEAKLEHAEAQARIAQAALKSREDVSRRRQSALLPHATHRDGTRVQAASRASGQRAANEHAAHLTDRVAYAGPSVRGSSALQARQ